MRTKREQAEEAILSKMNLSLCGCTTAGMRAKTSPDQLLGEGVIPRRSREQKELRDGSHVHTCLHQRCVRRCRPLKNGRNVTDNVKQPASLVETVRLSGC